MSTEYHKIETLYERDPVTFKVNPGALKNRTYSLLREWEWTEKVDGTNIRVMWDSAAGAVTFGGKTDNAQIHADLVKYLYATVTADKLLAVFPPPAPVVIYGEGYGAGIQKGGGYRPDKALIVYDVLVDGKWWLSGDNVADVCAKLGLDMVPRLGTMTLEAATEMVRAGFKSRVTGATCDAEGVVGRPAETLFDKKGARLIVKLKTKDFGASR